MELHTWNRYIFSILSVILSGLIYSLGWADSDMKPIKLELQEVRAGMEVPVIVSISLPPGEKLNAYAPSRFTLSLEECSTSVAQTYEIQELKSKLKFPIPPVSQSCKLSAKLILFHCPKDRENELCYVKRAVFEKPIQIEENLSAIEDMALKFSLKVD